MKNGVRREIHENTVTEPIRDRRWELVVNGEVVAGDFRSRAEAEAEALAYDYDGMELLDGPEGRL